MSVASKILKGAIPFIEKGLIRHEFSVDEKGNPVHPGNPKAVAWCIRGALTVAAMDCQNKDFERAVSLLGEAANCGAMVACWAGTKTKEEIVNTILKAAKLGEDERE